MIIFAILGLLIGLLFMFVRQKLSALESRVNLLTDTVQTMAGFRRVEDEEEDEDEDGEDGDDEDESESDDSDSESEQFECIEPEKIHFDRIEPEIHFDRIEPEKEEMKVVSDDEVESDVKKIQLETPEYENLSLKELKDKVSDLGGPKLRTKKELLDFLKNKI
jgi:hypothetical protein